MPTSSAESTCRNADTEGLTRSASIIEMVALETPARRASSRCDRPRPMRSRLSLGPIRKSSAALFMRSEFRTERTARQLDNDESRLPMFRKLDIRGPPLGDPMTTPVNPTAAARADIPNDLAAFWLPFTPNRAFKKRPRLIARSKDMHYYTPEGREILDGDRGALVLQRRPQPRAHRRGDPAPGGRARLLADLPVRPSAGVPALLAARRACAGRPRPRLLHQLGLGGRATRR